MEKKWTRKHKNAFKNALLHKVNKKEESVQLDR